ncbi:MAG: HNH endonuclease [Vicinamibacteria bacterium]|nr:HNH endonuclease [Vicinamibacteria bacterium]
MPFQPLTTCSKPGCRTLVRSGRCTAHRLMVWAQSAASSTARGYGASWKRIRAQVLREEGSCRRCGSSGRPTVDHIVPKAEGGTDERSNLQRLCSGCQQSKAGREGAAGRRRSVVSAPRLVETPGCPKRARGHNENRRGRGHNGRARRTAVS